MNVDVCCVRVLCIISTYFERILYPLSGSSQVRAIFRFIPEHWTICFETLAIDLQRTFSITILILLLKLLSNYRFHWVLKTFWLSIYVADCTSVA